MAQSQPSGGSGREVLHQDIGAADQVVQHGSGRWLLDVQGDAAFASVEPDKMAADAIHIIIVGSGEITFSGPFDLDHVGAHIGQMPGA